jgi:hypothetical protein
LAATKRAFEAFSNAKAIRRVFIGIDLDSPASRWAEYHSEGFAIALDGRSVRIEGGSLNCLRPIGLDISNEAHKCRVLLVLKRARPVKAYEPRAIAFGQFEASAAKITRGKRAPNIAAFLPYAGC